MKKLVACCGITNVLLRESLFLSECQDQSLADRRVLLRNWFDLGRFRWLMATIVFSGSSMRQLFGLGSHRNSCRSITFPEALLFAPHDLGRISQNPCRYALASRLLQQDDLDADWFATSIRVGVYSSWHSPSDLFALQL